MYTSDLSVSVGKIRSPIFHCYLDNISSRTPNPNQRRSEIGISWKISSREEIDLSQIGFCLSEEVSLSWDRLKRGNLSQRENRFTRVSAGKSAEERISI